MVHDLGRGGGGGREGVLKVGERVCEREGVRESVEGR